MIHRLRSAPGRLLLILTTIAQLAQVLHSADDHSQSQDFDPSKVKVSESTKDINFNGDVVNAVRIAPFILHDDQVADGKFVYYLINIEQPKEFSVTLTLYSGEADMYITKDTEGVPNELHYLKRTQTSKGDEIIISPEIFSDPQEIVRGYYLAVRGKDHAKFSILFMPEFDNLIKVQFQKLIEMTLTQGKNYYFDFYNLHDKYSTLLYAEESDIEVAALHYDLHAHEDFLSMVRNEDNYMQKFEFKVGDLPREKIFTNAITMNKHIIARFKAKNKDAKVNFVIYNPDEPIEVPAEKRFSFVQGKNETFVFHFRLNAKYEEVDLDVKLDFGSIVFDYSDIPTSFANEQKISVTTQKYFTYKVKKTEISNDIHIFKDFYVKVESSEFSKFSVLVKPRSKFKALKSSEPELVFTDPDKDVYLYYHISPNKRNSIHSLVIDFNSVHYYSQKPDLLFIAESDVVLDSDSPFLPMPLIDLVYRDIGEYRQIEIKPDIQSGFYVLKIGQFATRLPIKITVHVNHQRVIQPNGYYRGSIPLNKPGSHVYTMFIPQPGEFRLVLESCSKVNIGSAEFIASKPLNADRSAGDTNEYSLDVKTNHTVIKFDDIYVQGYEFLHVNETTRHEREFMKNLTYPVKRGFVHEKGVLKFRIEPAENPFLKIKHPDEFYALMTEFRPFERTQLFKDYVIIEKDQEVFNGRQFKWFFADSSQKLHIITKMPKFKPELETEMPRLTKVVIKFYFYLVGDPDIAEKIERCGISCMKTTPHEYRMVIRELPKDLMFNSYEDDQVQFHFWASELDKFSSEKHLHVVCFASLHFFEDEDDLYNVNLDFKYTFIPYFLLTIPNIKRVWLSRLTGVSIGILAVALFLVYVYWKIKVDHEKPNPTYSFQRPGDHPGTKEGNRLEMSTSDQSTADWQS
jgi:hypothetical protein